MKTFKWIVLLCLVIKAFSQSYIANNTCSNLGIYPPDNSGKCTVSSVSGQMCCFVSVKYSVNNTRNFCAMVSGSYLNPKSVEDLEKEIGSNYKVSVICGASLISFSLIFLSFISSLILF